MMKTLICVNCGREHKPNSEKTAWAKITLTQNEHCNTCNYFHNKEENVHFCTLQCLILFSQRNPHRLLKLEQDMLTDVKKYEPGYVSPLYDPVLQGKSIYELTLNERQLVADGKPIMAIKSVRERTHLGLKEAKDIIDKYKRG